ncbi:MAG: phosphoribosylamine--glycine ligase [Phycisphaeraceae bacterium]|nr:phosphoribosylamine--glycine ligase [Phycisphaeraceae bacterium]
MQGREPRPLDAHRTGNAINVLLMGSGGREHAIAMRLRESPRLGRLWLTDISNPGLQMLGTPAGVPVSIKEAYRLVQFCDHNDIGLVVIGPEDPLADGFADALESSNRLVFGPAKAAARLEADKAWSKQMMRAAAIPTAEGRVFSNPQSAIEYVRTREDGVVVKAAGLAKGKGVTVCDDPDEAIAAIQEAMVDRAFGEAGAKVVIEERLTGPELSVLALVDGRTIMMLPACQDHKRLRSGDTGPNTGGMGAFCPTPLASEEVLQRVEREVLVPIVDVLRRDEIVYRGVLYAGLMLTHAGPKVLEFNVRFGDPETQPLLSRLKGDLLELMLATASGRLHEGSIGWDDRSACCVVLASDGYPSKPRTGVPIQGVEIAEAMPEVVIHHAGTRRDSSGLLLTSGGRVLNVTGLGATLAAARTRAYEAVSKIHFEGMQYREDIGQAASAPARASSAARAR